MVTYTIGGKKGQKVKLKEASDYVVVRMKKEGTKLRQVKLSKSSKALCNNLKQVAAYPEADVYVYRCHPEDGKSAKVIRNSVRKALKEEKESVQFAGRVLTDDKGVLHLYTENIFVKFKDKLLVKECKAILKKHDLKIKDKISFAKNAYFVQPKSGVGQGVFDIANNLLKEKGIEYCNPEVVQHRKLKKIPNEQWHLKKTKINSRIVDAHVHVEEAWKTTQGQGVVVAIIDDGVDIDHPELKGANKIVAPRDMMKKSSDPRPKFQDDDHGTPCAGVAVGNGKKMAAGVAPKAKLMPIRLRAGLGSIREAEAFAWAADNGADVISCSWGPTDGYWADPSDPFHTKRVLLPDSTRMAIDYALRTGRKGKGCIIVWAAGNGREDIKYDGYANNPEVIAVAASNDTDRRAVYSDYGKNIYCCFPSGDMFSSEFNQPRPKTPGIWTTDRLGKFGYNPGAQFGWANGDWQGSYVQDFSGTSSATPGVAGIIALMLAVNPNLTLPQLKALIKNACDKIDTTKGKYNAKGHSIFYGYGKLNAAKAVALAKSSKASTPELDIEGFAEFAKAGFINMTEWVPVKSKKKREKFIGISLSVKPFHPNVGLKYQLIVNNKGKTGWKNDGDFVSAGDRRRKIIGIQLKLTGTGIDKYSIRYQAKFKKKKDWVLAEDGAVCGKKSGRGPALEGLAVEIIKKN